MTYAENDAHMYITLHQTLFPKLRSMHDRAVPMALKKTGLQLIKQSIALTL